MKIKKSGAKNKVLFSFTEKLHKNKMQSLSENKDALNSFFNKKTKSGRKKKPTYIEVTVKSGWSDNKVKQAKKQHKKLRPYFYHSFYVTENQFFSDSETLMNNLIEDLEYQRNSVIKKDKKYNTKYNDAEIQVRFGYKRLKKTAPGKQGQYKKIKPKIKKK